MSTTRKTIVKPYTMKDLAELYHVTQPTFRNWLKKHQDAIGERMGHTYTIRQVEIIFDRLGEP
jgi:hypothetical protein